MCQPASASPTEHVQNRPPALHVRRGNARDEHGMSLDGSPRVGDATLITFFFLSFVMLSAIIPPSCFCYCPHCLLSVVPAPLQHRQPRMMAAAPRGRLRLNAVSVRVKPMYLYLCIFVCFLPSRQYAMQRLEEQCRVLVINS